MLFQIHEESKISIKRLTDADLKRSPKSNQTHIGLSKKSLTFMKDNKTEYTAMLIYNSMCDFLQCEVGKILRKDGKQDAPNIKTGDKDENIVNSIREFAKENPDKPFYLIWFGLDTETPVFWLICKDSTDYLILSKFFDFSILGDGGRGKNMITLDYGNLGFAEILQYAKEKLQSVSLDLQKELEISVEMETDNPKFKDSDVKKARSYIQELGRSGEEIINEYLAKEKHKGSVSNYEWANKSGEVGNPYDFYIKYAGGNEQWVDVKTTEHEFDQAVIVSKREIKFITQKSDAQYSIFRVYSKEETQARLKICSGCLKYIKKLQRDIEYMDASMADYQAFLVNYKISFVPGLHSFGSVSNEILLTR